MKVPTMRSPAGLRDTLFELLDELRAGKTSRRDAQIQCEVARQIIETGRLEVSLVHSAKVGLELADSMERREKRLSSGPLQS